MTMNDVLVGAAVLWLLFVIFGIPGRTDGPVKDRRVAHHGQRGSQHRPLFGVVSGDVATAGGHRAEQLGREPRTVPGSAAAGNAEALGLMHPRARPYPGPSQATPSKLPSKL
jgi:hypothetical protein